MASALTEFRVELPLQLDPIKQTVVDTFRKNMITLCPIYDSDMYKYANDGVGNVVYDSQSHIMSGYITSVQQATALGFLNTLNTGLGKTVLCVTNAVTTQP